MLTHNSKEKPLVSVVVPIYNHADYLEQCLDSIAHEGYPNLEVLMIDDGSKDHSSDVVKNWRRKHQNEFTRFELQIQENQGLSRTLNRLVRMTTGRYITPLASDDYLLTGGIETRVKALQKHPHWLAVFGDCRVVDGSDCMLSESGVSDFFPDGARKGALLDDKLRAVEIAMRWSVPGPVFLMRRETPEIIGYYDESFVIEDRDYYLRLCARGALGFVDRQVAAYRWHNMNTHTDTAKEEQRQYALIHASKKAAQTARGLLKVVLFLDYHRRLNSLRLRRAKLNFSMESIKRILIRVAWKIMKIIQEYRYEHRPTAGVHGRADI